MDFDVPIQVRQPYSSQTPLYGDPTLCSVSGSLAEVLGIGDQVRVDRDGEQALYTVAEHRFSDAPDVIRMASAGRSRLGTASSNFYASALPAACPVLTDAEAEADGGFIERVDDDGQASGLVVLAPHGGRIERYTDAQAELLAGALPDTSSWICKGFRPGGEAFSRWHITSTKLSPSSFAGLGAIHDRGFAYAVAFHGMRDDGVVVGGGAPNELRAMVRDAIIEAIDDPNVPVVIASSNHPLRGTSSSNVVNWLTHAGQGGIQLEQSFAVRQQHGTAIAEALAQLYAGLI